jgi:hypothetical protein
MAETAKKSSAEAKAETAAKPPKKKQKPFYINLLLGLLKRKTVLP